MKRLAAVLVLALTVPGAAAQSNGAVAVSVEDWESPLRPEDPHVVTLLIEYDCSRVAQTDGSEAEIHVSRPGWLSVTGPETVTLDAETTECLGEETWENRTVDYELTVDRFARALDPGNVTFNVTAELIGGRASDTATRNLSAAFVPGIFATLDPSEVRFPTNATAETDVIVYNKANGPVRISVTPEDVPEGLDLDLPPTGRAEALTGIPIDYVGVDDPDHRWTGKITVEGSLPDDRTERIYDATVNVTARYAEDPTVGAVSRVLDLTAEVSAPAGTVGGGESLPGVGGAQVLVLVAGMAVALGRRTARPR